MRREASARSGRSALRSTLQRESSTLGQCPGRTVVGFLGPNGPRKPVTHTVERPGRPRDALSAAVRAAASRGGV
jgi:hypothetical protein